MGGSKTKSLQTTDHLKNLTRMQVDMRFFFKLECDFQQRHFGNGLNTYQYNNGQKNNSKIG